MKFSEKWLREWVDPPVDTAALVAQLTMAGLEVDAVEPAAGAFTGVVVGEVLSVEPHPNADKLRVCRVSVGGGDPLQIVCGAPNVHAGMRAPLAQVGAELPGGLEIKDAKLRGIASAGMLCSAKELGLADSAGGLLALPEAAPAGADLRRYLDLDDVSIDIDLTPNRGDCLSVAGIAREVGVLNRVPVAGPGIDPVAARVDERFPVVVAAPADCPRYVGRVIRGVDPGAATPLWMRERLRRSGLRSLGPGIDVTNYVLLELGQPMHAFDLARLGGGISVRRAQPGERLTLLDGRVIDLDPQVLVIADANGPLAMAGIMGGEHSGVEDTTRDIFLESAFFAPSAVAGRARRYGLQTDSSHRFERGVDPALQRRAMERATALLLEIMGGQAGPLIEVVSEPHLPVRAPIQLRAERIERVLGVRLDGGEVEDILGRLGMGVEPVAGGWEVTPPGFRFDMGLEVDLIEELGRIHGYANLPTTLPQGPLVMAPRPETRLDRGRLRDLLVARGYQEAITYSFVEPGLQRQLEPELEPLALANPLSADMAVMRTSLWPSLVGALRHNVNRQQDRVRLFELGMVFRPRQDGLEQTDRLGAVAWGPVRPEQWGEAPRPTDFFDVKADVEALLRRTGPGQAFRFAPAGHPALHPGQSALIEREGRPIGWVGLIHPGLEQSLELPSGVLLFELDLDAISAAALPRFTPLSKFPFIRRDLAVVVDEDVSAEALGSAVAETGGQILRELRIFDIYRGKGVEKGRKSIALGLILQDSSRTLTDADVDGFMASLMAHLAAELGATLRE